MSKKWIDPESCSCLAVLVESVIAPLLIQHNGPVCLELDVPTTLPVPADPRQTAQLLETLVQQSLAQMADGGDLMIMAVETAGGIEMELADSGTDVDSRPCSLPLAAAAIGANLRWQNVPQGGAAVTIFFGRRSESGRVAA
ncbi:MAG: ATPase [Pirellulaceae bacterium]